MKRHLIQGILQLIPLVIMFLLATMLLTYETDDTLKTVGEMMFGIAIVAGTLRLAKLGRNNIRKYIEERRRRKERGRSAAELTNVPWPDCYCNCELAKNLGVSECDNACPGKEKEKK